MSKLEPKIKAEILAEALPISGNFMEKPLLSNMVAML